MTQTHNKEKVIVFGSGMVAPPALDHLKRKNRQISVVTNEPERAEELIGDYPDGQIIEHDIASNEINPELTREMEQARVVISLLPYVFHTKIAQLSLDHQAHLLTASYITDEMQAFDQQARELGLLFMNECGLDPGLDHMSAMQVIDQISAEGGTVLGFSSYCGGLPEKESANNPFNYKFSWSPKGVLLATRNSASFLRDGQVVNIKEGRLRDSLENMQVGDDLYEGYPNRNSTPFKEIYGLEHAQDVIRGTLRYPGWTHMMSDFHTLGLLDDRDIPVQNKQMIEIFAEILRQDPSNVTPADLKGFIRDLDTATDKEKLIESLDWLGFFTNEVHDFNSSDTLPVIDILTHIMLDKMQYAQKERDIVVMKHTITYRTKDGEIKTHDVDLYVRGDETFTAMARTTGLTAGIVANLMFEGKIPLIGVQRPIQKEVYDLTLAEMESHGVKFKKSD